MCRLPPTGARGRRTWPTFCIEMEVTTSPPGHAATLSAGRNYAISTRSRRITRTARQSARMVSAGTAGLRVGRSTASPERARQIAIWGRDPRRGKPTAEPTAPVRLDRRTLLAGWRSPRKVGLPTSHPVSSLAGRTEPARSTTARGSPGRLLRPRCLGRRMRSLSSHGRYAHPGNPSLRTVSPAAKAL
jgi:hypothetical protein